MQCSQRIRSYSMTCCLLAIVALLPATLARAVELTEAEATLVAKTNEMRARHGLPPLMVSAQLMESARKHAIWMASQGSLTHTSEAVAENIAWGQADATDAVESWMNSSGHRANILNSQYTEIGVAGYFVRGRRIYWCQQFRN